MRGADDAKEHIAIANLVSAHLSKEPELIEELPDALKVAEELGLMNDAESARTAALRRWGDCSPVTMPPRWKAQITRYNRWANAHENQYQLDKVAKSDHA